MTDKALEISGWCWKWYKKAISIEKGDVEWETLIDAAIKQSKEYQDELNKKLFEDMFLAFETHVERIEKMKNDTLHGSGK